MKLIQKPFYSVTRLEIERRLKDKESNKEALDVIFGDLYNDSKYDVIFRRSCNKTPLQRFNMIWVLAFTLLISPIQYIKNGSVGWDRHSKLGNFFLKITGEMKEK